MTYMSDRGISKFKDILRRKNDLTMWDDMYNGLQLFYTEKEILKQNVNIANRTLLTDRIAYKNLTKSIIDKLAILFQSGYKVTIEGNDVKTTELRNKLKKYKFDEMLPTLNKQTKLLLDTHVTVRWDDVNSKVIFDLIKPDITFIEQRKEYPTEAQLIAYIINEDLDSHNGNTVNTVNVWTNEWNYIGEIKKNGEIVSIDDEPVENKFGYIPVIHFSNDYRTNTYFSYADQPVVSRNLQVNTKFVEFLAALSLQSLSTLVLSGKLNDLVIPMGMQHVLYMEQSSDKLYGETIINDAKYINPDAPLEVLNEAIKDIEIQTALEYGINAEAYKSTSTATSGYQVKLNKQDLVNSTNEDIPLYESGLTLLIQTMMRLENFNSTSVLWTDEDIDNVNFTINPIVFENDELTDLNILEKEISIGINSAINYLMGKHSIDRDKATEMYKQFEIDNNQGGVTQLLPTNIEEIVPVSNIDSI